jgi:hypothetical protein
MENIIPSPLFEDPIYGACADPVMIWNREEKCWWILYTQRRLTFADKGVSGVHGSAIGVASSRDGFKWLYRGTLPGLDFEGGHNTFWAPEIIYARGEYHMYVSYITGVPADWDYERHIIHYTADNLWQWKFKSIIPLSSERVIDACVYEIPGGKYKMWYKDENHQSHSYAAVSDNLYDWTVLGDEVSDCPHEGPNVFELDGKKWMITDCWDGLAVYRSDDFTAWKRQGPNLLRNGSGRPGDTNKGHHADVLSNGREAYIFYFVHPDEQPDVHPQFLKGRAVIQAAVLRVENDCLVLDGNGKFELQGVKI